MNTNTCMVSEFGPALSDGELVGRVVSGETELYGVFAFGDIEVNIALRRIWRRGEEVRMPPGEFNLLAFFLRNVDIPLTRETLLSQVWGYQVQPKTRTVDVHVVRLRQKLEPDPDVPRHFQTIHGFGYRFMMRPARPLSAICMTRAGIGDATSSSSPNL